jgi:hypothetical protein
VESPKSAFDLPCGTFFAPYKSESDSKSNASKRLQPPKTTQDDKQQTNKQTSKQTNKQAVSPNAYLAVFGLGHCLPIAIALGAGRCMTLAAMTARTRYRRSHSCRLVIV